MQLSKYHIIFRSNSVIIALKVTITQQNHRYCNYISIIQHKHTHTHKRKVISMFYILIILECHSSAKCLHCKHHTTGSLKMWSSVAILYYNLEKKYQTSPLPEKAPTELHYWHHRVLPWQLHLWPSPALWTRLHPQSFEGGMLQWSSHWYSGKPGNSGDSPG